MIAPAHAFPLRIVLIFIIFVLYITIWISFAYVRRNVSCMVLPDVYQKNPQG